MADSHNLLRETNQFMVAAANSRIAIIEVVMTTANCHQLSIPISNIAGLKMKTNGRMAVRSE